AVDMRSLAMQGLLCEAALGLLAQARSLLGWHANHPFCARCGNDTAMEQGGVRRRCATCNSLHFPRVDPVVIMLAIDGENCLLGRSHNFDAGRYSTLAGFVEPGETIEDAVRRETFEEAGIEIGEVVYFTSQPWPFVSTLMIGCHARALSRDIVLDTDEMDDCRWFSRTEARQIMAGSHSQGITAPPEMAIAYRLIAAFVDAG
ncbi:MAG: NAD(+) diphosphatase, partial [Alphaproteobacteria bacterium]